jgi:hypothetical protein
MNSATTPMTSHNTKARMNVLEDRVDLMGRAVIRRALLAKHNVHVALIDVLRAPGRPQHVYQAVLNALLSFMVGSPDRVADCAISGLKRYGARFNHGFCCVMVWVIGLQLLHGARFSTEIYTRGCRSHACSLEALHACDQ